MYMKVNKGIDYRITIFDKFSDDRGDLVVFLKNTELKKENKTYGQIYFVTFEKSGIVRGNHYHKKWREWFGIVTGKVKVYLEDVKTKVREEFIMDSLENKYIRLEIGPNVAHTFVSISESASLLNYASTEWNPKDDHDYILVEENNHKDIAKKINYYIHPKATVETTKIGEGSRIWANTHILSGATIGKEANICDLCFIENKVVIGDNVTLKCGVYVWDGVTIEDNVQVGPSVTFTNDLYPKAKNKNFKLENTLLKKGCSIGANTTIIAGITIGKNSLVGAGSVVTKDIPDNVICYGNPAIVKAFICDCGQKLNNTKETVTCPKCNIKFNINLKNMEIKKS